MSLKAELRRCVQALAQPAAVQISLFPDFAIVGDELALQFDEALRAYRTSEPVGAVQRGSLNDLDDYLATLSGPEDEHFWLDRTALASDVRWQRVRDLARAVLAAFNWPDGPPLRDGATYVASDKIEENI
jgi:hypothetical protein